jgi:hypothetical protein
VIRVARSTRRALLLTLGVLALLWLPAIVSHDRVPLPQPSTTQPGTSAPGSSGPSSDTTAAPTNPEPGTGATAPASESSTDVRFSPSSFWYEALPASTPPNPDGRDFGAAVQAQVKRYYGTVAVNTVKYSPTMYTVGPEQPAVKVTPWDCQHKGYLDSGLARQLAAVPVPSDAVVANDNDAHLVVWQPSSDTLWEMWKARRLDGQWQACWGGRLSSTSSSNGVLSAPYGSTATGISVGAGLVTISDLRQGHIDHALVMSLVETRSGVYSWPANRTDGWKSGKEFIPEGQRLRLDPTLDLSTLSLTPVGQMIAVAMQTYGVVIRDKAGSVALYAESPLPTMATGQPNPYDELFGGTPSYALLNGIPWDRLQALPFDYGKPG